MNIIECIDEQQKLEKEINIIDKMLSAIFNKKNWSEKDVNAIKLKTAKNLYQRYVKYKEKIILINNMEFPNNKIFMEILNEIKLLDKEIGQIKKALKTLKNDTENESITVKALKQSLIEIENEKTILYEQTNLK